MARRDTDVQPNCFTCGSRMSPDGRAPPKKSGKAAGKNDLTTISGNGVRGRKMVGRV